MRQKQITVPKTFFVEERDKFYSNWIEAFPREFVQNSVDAGAKNIAIRIETAPAKGAFGAEPTQDAVTRVTFEDDGGGMSRKVLDEVFFALGGSTKRDEDGAVGGFGRARIMQAFSQLRYSIRTRDCIVEGDGPSYDVVSVPEAEQAISEWAEKARSGADAARLSGEYDRARRLDAAADLHLSDLRRLHEDGPTLAGCRFEVDLDPRNGDGERRKPTADRVRRAFAAYFSQSDIKCRVTINGEEVTAPARKLEGRKKLTATMDAADIPDSFRKAKAEILDRADGRKDVVFATISTIKKKDFRPDEEGKLNVRVRGASMFRDSANSDDFSLILEIVPGVARDVLTSNRDAIRQPFRASVEEFTRMMATDASKALDSREDEEFTVIPGGQGFRRRERARPPGGYDAPRNADTPHEHIRDLTERARRTDRYVHVDSGAYEWNTMVRDGIEGVPMAEVRSFLAVAKKDPDATFLAQYPDRQAVEAFTQALQRQGEHSALVQGSGTLMGHIVDNLKLERARLAEKRAEAHREKMAELNSVPILRKDLAPPESHYPDAAERKSRRNALMQASRRFDPRNWDTETGKGKAPHQLLAAWTVMVDNAVDLLLQVLPKKEPFPYATGWTFSHKKHDYIAATGGYGWTNTGALHLKPDRNGPLSYFLLNPLECEEFKLGFDVRDPADLTRLWTTAVHEVAHVAASDHNTAFAYAMTHMMEKANPAFMAKVLAEVEGQYKAITGVYGKGRTKVRPMDDEAGPRPAERLLAGLVPESEIVRQADGGFTVEAGVLGRADALVARYLAPEPDPEEEMAPSPMM